MDFLGIAIHLKYDEAEDETVPGKRRNAGSFVNPENETDAAETYNERGDQSDCITRERKRFRRWRVAPSFE